MTAFNAAAVEVCDCGYIAVDSADTEWHYDNGWHDNPPPRRQPCDPTPMADHASQRDGRPIGNHASQRDGDNT